MPDRDTSPSPTIGGDHEAVVDRLGAIYRTQRLPALVTKSFKAGSLLVTEIKSTHAIGMTAPVEPEDAYLLSILMEDLSDFQCWEDGCTLARRDFSAGESMLRDLKRRPAALIDQPLHQLGFYFSRIALDQLADDVEALPIHEMQYRPDETTSDPVVRCLAEALLPALRAPEQVNRLFLDHVLHAIALHVGITYGGLKVRAKPVTGGLAGWQEKRAKEMLAADLSGHTPLSEIASACGLSTSQFTRAFRRTTGTAPHRWLIQHRVKIAKRHISERSMPLAAVALACGFADQSHLTRVFAAHTGVTPAAWRRSA